MQPAAWPLKNSLTMRSSSEWKLDRPPAARRAAARGRPRRARGPATRSSSLTTMRSAWNTRRAGLPAPKRAGVGMVRLMISTSWPVVANGRRCALGDDAARDVLGVALLAVAPEDVGQLVGRQAC